MNNLLMGIPLVCVGAVFGAFGSLFFKRASASFSLTLKGILQKDLLIGFALYCSAAGLTMVALRFGDLSLLYPFVAIGYITSALIGWKTLGEPMNKGKMLAIALIILGLVLEVV